MIRTFRDLDVWQRSMRLVSDVYSFASMLPADERLGLVAQMRRASVSVPANIAEGHERDSTRDYLRFVSISLASLAELSTLIELAALLHGGRADDLQSEVDDIRRMLRGLQGSLKAKLSAPSSLLPAP